MEIETNPSGDPHRECKSYLQSLENMSDKDRPPEVPSPATVVVEFELTMSRPSLVCHG